MIPREHLDVRIALVWGLVMGVGYAIGVPQFQPEQLGFATDVYHLAGEAFLAGETPYTVSPADTGSAFIYPPITLIGFVPHALAGSFLAAYLLQLTLNLVTAGALTYLLFSYCDGQGIEITGLDRWLVAAFVLFSVHSTTVYVMGQVNLQLALAIAVGGVLTERSLRGRERSNHNSMVAGTAFAAAASVKLFPAAAGAWLIRLRRWRAVVAAIVTGVSLFLAGVLVVGVDATRTYVTDVLPAESKTAEFAGGLPPEAMYVTIRRPISALLPSVDPSLYAVLGLLVLAPLVLASYRVVGHPVGRATALLATMLGTLLALPFEAYFFSLLYFPLVPLLYRLEAGSVRRLLAAGTILLSTTISYEPLTVWFGALPFPPGLEAAMLDGLRVLLGFVQPPLVGGVLVLVACALWHHQHSIAPAGAETADAIAPEGEK